MPTLKQGQTTTKDHLNAYFYIGGSLSDPYTVSYSLYDRTTGTDQLIGLPNRTPIKFSTGSYYAPWTIPDDEPLGIHRIKWEWKQSATSEIAVEYEEFEIVSECTAIGITFPESILYLIRHLRAKLRDIHPDADYHFSPPSKEQTIAGFTETRGYRWSDEQLYYHLVQAANYINLIPPDTDFGLESYPAPWQSLLLLQAMSYALWDLSILWINEEFNYSLNGISLDISRSDKYQSAAQSMQDQVNTQTELAKSRIHIIRGLAQNRYTYARGAALGPWCLSKDSKVYDFDRDQLITIEDAYNQQIKHSFSMNENNQLVKNGVSKIWSNGEQELFDLYLDDGKRIRATCTHKFFVEDGSEVEMEKLTIGQKIWVISDDNGLELVKVMKVEYFGEGMTYDMEMNEPYRNYVANGMVVHNTGGQNVKRWISGGGSFGSSGLGLAR